MEKERITWQLEQLLDGGIPYEEPYTSINLDFAPRQHHVIVFERNKSRSILQESSLSQIDAISILENTIHVKGWIGDSSHVYAKAQYNDETFIAETILESPPTSINDAPVKSVI